MPVISPRSLELHPFNGSFSSASDIILCSTLYWPSEVDESDLLLMRPIDSSIQSNKTSGSELPVGMGLSISLRENTPPAQIQRLKSLGHILAAD